VEAVDMEVVDDVQLSRGEEVPAINARTTLEDMSFVTLNSVFQIMGMCFEWAFQEQGMTKGADGLFYDQEGIQYRRSSFEGAYKFAQVTSILDETSLMDVVHSPEVEAEDGRALNDTELQTLHEVCLVLNIRPTASEEGGEIGTQSSRVIVETPKVMD